MTISWRVIALVAVPRSRREFAEERDGRMLLHVATYDIFCARRGVGRDCAHEQTRSPIRWVVAGRGLAEGGLE
jgi:hypothetical protein